MTDVPPDFDWPAPWRPLPFPDGRPDRVASIEAELEREVPPGHVLYGLRCRAVAYNTDDSDDFVFVTDRADVQVAYVHLTWRPEHDPKWPYTVAYPGWDALRLACQERDEGRG
jgi:hypothetical protein